MVEFQLLCSYFVIFENSTQTNLKSTREGKLKDVNLGTASEAKSLVRKAEIRSKDLYSTYVSTTTAPDEPRIIP